MEFEEWEREIEVEGAVYRVTFIKRPFREGLEVRVPTAEGAISVAELGLGERALLEKVKSLIKKSPPTSG